MTESDTDNSASGNAPEYSVSELAFALKRTVEDSYGQVRVRGEVIELTQARSGHVYFKLKDDKATIDSICWKGVYARLRFPPEEGTEVIAVGKVTTYPPRSTYQIIIESIELAGEGALLARLEKLRLSLAAEGLFDADRKQRLPYLPSVIGVVTSPTGAVFRDILHRLRERFPRQVLLWPVPVQGKGAAEKIAAAIEGFNALAEGGRVPRPDVLIVGRGGGSLEDLWAFNEEVVVRAAAASEIPLISAVGHETDTTLIDFAADLRAPTPTAAAEFAVPVREDLIDQIAGQRRRLMAALSRLMSESRAGLRAAARGLRDPRDLLNIAQQRYDGAGARLGRTLRHGLDRKALQFRETAGGQRLSRALLGEVARHRAAFAGASGRLRPGLVTAGLVERRRCVADAAQALSPSLARRMETRVRRLEASARLLGSLGYQNVLARGFALVRDGAGQPVKEAARASPGMAVMIEFHDGSVGAHVDDGATPKDTSPAGSARPKAGAKPSPRTRNGSQGKLF